MIIEKRHFLGLSKRSDEETKMSVALETYRSCPNEKAELRARQLQLLVLVVDQCLFCGGLGRETKVSFALIC